jgi:predicted Zn-dependent protease
MLELQNRLTNLGRIICLILTPDDGKKKATKRSMYQDRISKKMNHELNHIEL